MGLILLSLKSVSGNWWRSLALGLFVFLTSFILIIFNAFFSTVTTNMQESLINSLTGHVQIRSPQTTEEDMLAMRTSWSGVHHLSQTKLEEVIQVLNNEGLKFTERIRYNAMLSHGLEEELVMFVGLDPRDTHYQAAFGLEEGRYINPGASGEIMLSTYHAGQLNVSPGDEIQAISDSGTVTFTVVGIGDVQMLSLFGYNAVYSDLESAGILAGFEAGEVSDIIVFASNAGQTSRVYDNLAAELKGVTLSVWEDMGGFVFDGISVYKGMFILFIIVMMIIVSILIINLVFMMGLERRQEIGTLKAIGYSRPRIIQIFLSEILSITILFCTLGIAAGSGLVIALSSVPFELDPPMDFVMGKVFYIQYDIQLIFPVAAIIILFTMAAALWPSWHAASLNPVDTMND